MKVLHPDLLLRQLRIRLAERYDPGEAAAVAEHYLTTRLATDRTRLLMGKTVDAEDDLADRMEREMLQLAEGVPVQYVLGSEEFDGHAFTVTPDVLIPRPETLDLVAWCATLAAECPNPRLLDAGTGSGCIAVSLALRLPHAEVHAWDISERALGVAAANARRLRARVNFERRDLLEIAGEGNRETHREHAGTGDLQGKFDFIVSNPPYIPQGEAREMHENVVAHEPHTALFVPDADPLLFYRALARLALTHLHRGGALLVETHTRHARDTARLFVEAGLVEAEVRADLFGKPRMVKVVRP